MTSKQNTTIARQETPNVSVVIPTYNRASLLPRAIRSVLAQTYQDIEIIIVDDASTDDTQRQVESFDDPRIRYIRHGSNRGAASARNTGIKAARGRLIAFQDSDDEWLLDKLEKQVGLLHSSNAEERIVYCGFILFSYGSVIYIPNRKVRTKQGKILSGLLSENFISTQTLLVPRKCFDVVGDFDEQMGRFQDWELVIRLAAEFEFLFINEPLVIAHQTPGNISSNVAAAIDSIEIIIDKNRALFARNHAQLAKHFVYLGQLRCFSGSLHRGRSDFFKAINIKILSWEPWIGVLVSFLGEKACRFIWTAVKYAGSIYRCVRTDSPNSRSGHQNCIDSKQVKKAPNF